MTRLVVAAAAPVSVGVVRWHDPRPRVTFAVRVLARESQGGRWVTSGRPTDPLPTYAFAPRKPGCDVAIVGHAYPPGVADAAAVDAWVGVGELGRGFTARSATPLDRVPLARELAPRDLADELAARSFTARAGFDFARFCAAAPEMRLDAPAAPGAPVRLVGLSKRGERVTTLPPFAPRLWLDMIDGRRVPVELACDTLVFDTATDEIELVFRGEIAVLDPSLPSVDRVVVALDDVDAPRSEDEIVRDLPRASFLYVQEIDARDPEPADDERDALTMARYATWAADPPDPETTLEEFAAISAELAEQREPRDVTLLRYGFEEDGWALEERAWLERMGRASLDGDASIATDFGGHFERAARTLASPRELERTVVDYVAIAIAFERADDPGKALASAGISLAAWMRLDRRFQRAAADDPEVAAAIERERARHEAAPKPAGASDAVESAGDRA
ncbi:MAG TPA: DUF2169 domain-containing protein [Byssovorax sp.]